MPEDFEKILSPSGIGYMMWLFTSYIVVTVPKAPSRIV